MSTWKLAPDTGQIVGTHSDMPLVVIPSELEIGSLTLAQAQSSRFYTDSGLVTEVAREVVGADEIHFKGSSVSSSSEFWLDEDGVRSDYAVTATYGRNAVWSDYERVYHLQETSGAVIDSSGNDDGTNSGATTGSTGQIGNGYDFDGTNDVINGIASTGTVGTNDISMSAWFKGDSYNSGSNQRNQLIVNYGSGNSRAIVTRSDNTNDIQIDTFDGSSVRSHGAPMSDTASRHYFVGQTTSGNVLTSYLDGSVGSSSTYIGGGNSSNGTLQIGGDANATYNWDGIIDEVRIRLSILSANWITTEYNNQNDNASFWVATAAGGGGYTGDIKSIAGVAQADIKSIAGVANADIKSIAGVSNV